MRKLLSIYYCWDEIGNANSNQNHRQYKGLSYWADIKILYRQFTSKKYGDGIIGLKSPSFLFFDRLLLKCFQSLKLVWSLDIFFWGCKMLYYARKRKEKFDVVLLTGTPYVLFWMAQLLSKQKEAKLVVQMYDPLADNNYTGGKSCLRELLEKRIVNSSDLVIIHSELMYSLLCDRYPKHIHKLRFIPFATDFIQLPYKPINRMKKLTLLYAGTLQNERNLELVFKALLKLSVSDLNKIKIQLIGSISFDIRKQILKFPHSEVFELLPFMNKGKLYNYMQQAHVLLVIDSFKDNKNIFFPSKICEYLLFKKPIFLITPDVSESRRLFSKCQDLCFNLKEESKLAMALTLLIKDRTAYDNRLDYSQIIQFDPSNVGKEIANNIEELFIDNI